MKVTFTEGRTEPSEKHPEGQPDWRWTLDGDNGEPLSVSSEGYVDKRDAQHGFGLSAAAYLDLTAGLYRRFVYNKDTRKPVPQEIEIAWVHKAGQPE